MRTDLPYEKVLADMPDYRATSDHDWMCYLIRLGFEVEQVDENDPPVTALVRSGGCKECEVH